MIVFAPICTSPPAKTAWRSVMKLCGLVWIVVHLVHLTPDFSSSTLLSAAWPIAGITVLHLITNSEPGIGTGRRRPRDSASPVLVFPYPTPVTLPFSSVGI